MSKCYTPSIEEFHVGFEYELERFNDDTFLKEWIKYIFPTPFSFNDSTGQPDLVEVFYSQLNCSRVKYLDQEDIESLGFKFEREEQTPYCKAYLYIKYTSYGEYSLSKLEITDNISISFNDKSLFVGIIKNKSELKQILKKIGYEFANDY